MQIFELFAKEFNIKSSINRLKFSTISDVQIFNAQNLINKSSSSTKFHSNNTGVALIVEIDSLFDSHIL